MFESPAKKMVRKRNERTAEAKAIAERLEAAKMATMLPGNKAIAQAERERLSTPAERREAQEKARVEAARAVDRLRNERHAAWQRLRAAAKAAAAEAEAATTTALQNHDIEAAATAATRAAAMRSLQAPIDHLVRLEFQGVPFINVNAAEVQ